MDRRRRRRVATHLPVRVWGVDAKGFPFTQMARVRNISNDGAVLQGVLRPVKAGELLHVQLGRESAEFKVVWIGKGSRHQSEVGIQNISSQPYIWDVNLVQCSEFVGKG